MAAAASADPPAAASRSRRLALSRDQPVTATTSSSNLPLSFFDAARYARVYFAVSLVGV